ncbi:hypothetical protein QY917_06705 [Diaphorobacter sp. C33]|uniref:hypothetical protein n=1 Tax=Diaphorobacter TaxID=238749 RepID=UPI0026604611|nr:hypothetical protein [Diaphorobacter sp. C33]WKK90836.1 hypothetical protein QY917_06705 [Diaphorobacter sp. C33]
MQQLREFGGGERANAALFLAIERYLRNALDPFPFMASLAQNGADQCQVAISRALRRNLRSRCLDVVNRCAVDFIEVPATEVLVQPAQNRLVAFVGALVRGFFQELQHGVFPRAPRLGAELFLFPSFGLQPIMELLGLAFFGSPSADL